MKQMGNCRQRWIWLVFLWLFLWIMGSKALAEESEGICVEVDTEMPEAQGKTLQVYRIAQESLTVTPDFADLSDAALKAAFDAAYDTPTDLAGLMDRCCQACKHVKAYNCVTLDTNGKALFTVENGLYLLTLEEPCTDDSTQIMMEPMFVPAGFEENDRETLLVRPKMTMLRNVPPENDVPPENGKINPPTGDQADLRLWSAFLAISLLLMGILRPKLPRRGIDKLPAP